MNRVDATVLTDEYGSLLGYVEPITLEQYEASPPEACPDHPEYDAGLHLLSVTRRLIPPHTPCPHCQRIYDHFNGR
jgi:hypothetical protein